MGGRRRGRKKKKKNKVKNKKKKNNDNNEKERKIMPISSKATPTTVCSCAISGSQLFYLR